MSKYLVAGAAGFIANRVTEFLLAAGHTVVGIDNLNDAYDVQLKHWRLNQLKDRSLFRFLQLDITDRQMMRKLPHEMLSSDPTPFDGVINLAARAGVRQSVADPAVYFETNVLGTLNLLDLCRDHGIKKFVLASTSSLYGQHNSLPYHEEQSTDYPLSPYAASKKAAEELCYTYHYLHGLDITVFRFFTVYGPAGRPDMSLFRFVQWINEGRPVTIFGDGQQSRDFTFVDDIARGTIAGLRPLGYEVINLGSDDPVVLGDAVRLVEELLGKQAQVQYAAQHPADISATWADISKAQRLLQWSPQTAFPEGVMQLVKWYQENRSWARDVVT